MRIGTPRDIEFECPRCRRIEKDDERAARCPDCGAKLVHAHSPSEAWIRAYLYKSPPRRVPSRA